MRPRKRTKRRTFRKQKVNNNYYQILGVNRNSSPEEIREAYRLYASKFHPDKHQGDKFFEEKFKEIKEAYDILSDPEQRRKYDAQYFRNSDSTFKQQSKTSNTHTSQQEKRTDHSAHDNTQTHTRQSSYKLKTEKQQRRQKNFIIGIGTALACVLLMELGGKTGYHVPIAMGFLFWTIRQIWVVLVSFIPD